MFQIKIIIPQSLRPRDPADQSALEAIGNIYRFPEDQVIFQWDDMEFSAFIASDINDSWLDILRLNQQLNSGVKQCHIQFPSQTFWHYWQFKEIDEQHWEIEAMWGNEDSKKIKVSKAHFQSEWQKMIHRIETDLQQQGYELKQLREYKNEIK